MATYEVAFIQTYCYEVEANSEKEAFDEAREAFDEEVRRPTANTGYDDFSIDKIDENGVIKTIKPFDSF